MTKLKKSGSALIREYEKKVKALKADLIKHIEALPDNPRIKRIGSEGKAFTISSKDLGNDLVLSPFYHDFKSQYEALIKIIDTKPIETVISDFEEIAENGFVRKTTKANQRFHPDVQGYLREMM